MNSILIITSLLIIFSIFSHALIKLGIGISNKPDKTDV
ncbi:YnaM/YnfT family protein [Escherichia coli]|nr:YnaM/YnfT family protein [Escherichia coli]